MILRKTLLKMQMKRDFGKYIDENTINNIVNNNLERRKPEEIECGYIICEIIQNDEFENNLEEIIKYSNHNFLIDIYGTIIIFSAGKYGWMKDKDINIMELINEYVKNIPNNILKNIRCIHGMEIAKIGNYGGNGMYNYMMLLNNFYCKLLELNTIKYGEIKKINNE